MLTRDVDQKEQFYVVGSLYRHTDQACILLCQDNLDIPLIYRDNEWCLRLRLDFPDSLLEESVVSRVKH